MPASQKNIDLVFSSNIKKAPIEGDEVQLEQAFLNILINAAQACETVTSRPSAITIRLYPTDNHIVLQISDNGCGMSEETLSKMFDAFYTTKPVGTGTGVGMSIVLQMLKKHQCTIKVTSEPDVGTQVTIHFPLPVN